MLRETLLMVFIFHNLFHTQQPALKFVIVFTVVYFLCSKLLTQEYRCVHFGSIANSFTLETKILPLDIILVKDLFLNMTLFLCLTFMAIIQLYLIYILIYPFCFCFLTDRHKWQIPTRNNFNFNHFQYEGCFIPSGNYKSSTGRSKSKSCIVIFIILSCNCAFRLVRFSRNREQLSL